MNGNEEFGYRLAWAVDVEKYSSRDARAQLAVQRELSGALATAAAGAGLDRGSWHTEPRGDGEFAVLPLEVDVAGAVGGFTRELAAALAVLNEGKAGRQRLRLRFAMHYGTLTLGPLGYAGQAPTMVGRLLDSRPLRQSLSGHLDRDLALAVSGGLYDDVIATGFCALDPRCFEAFRITVQGAVHRGYVYEPASMEHRRPMRAEPLRAAAEEADRSATILSLGRCAQ
ncbi:hypothetical protein ACRYCC_33470 [Actinomadura scrupuli]|uniref:hypothetical protein n=1 Tax=Actinomadura scrupuli TaxID=559629 RepID=UPI003D982802